MNIVGLVVTLLGFGIAFASLGVTAGVNGRMAMVLVGIVVSLVGSLGLINAHYQKTAVWKR